MRMKATGAAGRGSECARRRPAGAARAIGPPTTAAAATATIAAVDADALQRPGLDAVSLPKDSSPDGEPATARWRPRAPPPPPPRRRRRRLRFASPAREAPARGRVARRTAGAVARAVGARLGGALVRRRRVGVDLVGARRFGQFFLGRGVFRGALGAPALAPLVGVGGRDRRLDDRAPVERDVGVLRFERAAHVGIERLAADLHVGRRAKPVQHARPDLAAAVRRRRARGRNSRRRACRART